MLPIAVISFDLDGTLAEDAFDQRLWFEEIPRRYGLKHGLTIEEAKRRVTGEYRALQGHPRWTDMGFWFDRFGLGDWREAVAQLAPMIRLYPETIEVLEKLQDNYRLIVITQAERKFHKLKLGVGGLGRYIERVYSTPDQFGKLTKDKDVYRTVLCDLDIEAGAMLHVGDDRKHDLLLPRQLGIQALWLDRSGAHGGPDVVHDLWALFDRL